MVDIKKKMIEEVEGLIRKGEVPDQFGRTIVTKIELADPRWLQALANKFDSIRKAVAAEEDEDEVKKAGAASAAPTPAPTPTPNPAAAPQPAPSNASSSSNVAGIGQGGTPTTAGVGG